MQCARGRAGRGGFGTGSDVDAIGGDDEAVAGDGGG